MVGRLLAWRGPSPSPVLALGANQPTNDGIHFVRRTSLLFSFLPVRACVRVYARFFVPHVCVRRSLPRCILIGYRDDRRVSSASQITLSLFSCSLYCQVAPPPHTTCHDGIKLASISISGMPSVVCRAFTAGPLWMGHAGCRKLMHPEVSKRSCTYRCMYGVRHSSHALSGCRRRDVGFPLVLSSH